MASSSAAPDYARERRLIEQLEFRIASAETSQKLQELLQKFLPALILKLGTADVANRNLTIKVCQYINQRLKIDETIQLPVAALTQTFRESSSAFVRQFSLLFIQQGLDRISHQDGLASLPALLRFSIQKDTDDVTDLRISSLCIDFLLQVLRYWKAPTKGSKEDLALVENFQLSAQQTWIISEQLSSYLLYDPKSSIITIDDDTRKAFVKHFPARSTIVPNIAEFLFTSIFSDIDRFKPATILSVDANANASSRADTMFKQCNFDLESEGSIDVLFDLYPQAKTRLKTRILGLLSRSKLSTTRVDDIVQIIEAQLNMPTPNLEERKLQAAMFTYLTWTVRVGDDMHAVAARLQTSLRDFIETQGWPVPVSGATSETGLRAQAYESIGLLSASATDSLSGKRVDLISWLFASLRSDTSRDVRHSIEDSLSRLLTSTVAAGTDDLQKLKDLLLWNILAKEGDEDPIYFLPTHTMASYPAIRFANRILPLSDVDARIMDVLALTSEKREVVEEAQRGLDPSWHAANRRIAGPQQEQPLYLPDLETFAEKVFQLAVGPKAQLLLSRSSIAMAGLATFCRNLIAVQAWSSTEFTVSWDNSEWNPIIEKILANELDARNCFRTSLAALPEHLVVQLLQVCYQGMADGSADCAQVGLQITSLVANSVLKLLDANALLNIEVASRIIGVREASCRILGVVLSARPEWADGVDQSISALTEWQAAVGQQVVAVEVLLLKSAYVISRAALRGQLPKTESFSTTTMDLCLQIVQKSSDKTLREVAYVVAGQLGLCLPHSYQAPESAKELVELMLSDAKKENETAITSLGRLLFLTWDRFDDEKQQDILGRLLELHEVRKVEFQFAMGEALAVATLGFDSSSTITDFDVDATRPASQARVQQFNHLLDDFIQKSTSTKPSLRKANGIWLLSLIQFCTLPDLVKPKLRDSQAAFSRLLNDRDEIVQETGSRGLGIVYEKGDKSLREDLVRDLVQSFTGNTAKTAGSVTENTQLFEPGALPTENGQSVTTYKDIVSLAQEMGDPSLVYRFMNLAANNSIWTNRAAFGRFGLSGVLADSTYLQENKKFYPKLFRYRFDPNPNVQRSMEDIWKALVKDPNAVIDQNFGLIMEDLLKSIVYGREWRVREASCSAISHLVQGQEVEKFEDHLDDIWKVAFKVLDDVKESVRVAAMKLCRTLTNMLIRNLEVGEGTSKRATTMLRHAMPFLLQQMDAGAGKEVQQYAIVTLLDVVKKAPPRSLSEYAPIILETLINSLSSLEHESINYLHLNADKYGLTAEKLDGMRVSSVGTSPVSDAIERCVDSLSATRDLSRTANDMDVDEVDHVADAMRRLESSFKVTIGLPSKVGLSRTIITLVVRHHNMFRQYADRFTRLTRKSILDRNATISQSFSTALAYLLRLASDKEVRQTIAYVKKLYFESQDLSHRAVAGEVIQVISKVSNDVFTNFASSFIPFTFVGRQDLDDDTREKFETVWKDNVGGPRTLHLYLSEIVDLIRKHIESTLWPIRHACCFAISDLVASTGREQKYSSENAKVLWPLVDQSLSGKTWDGKGKVVSTFPIFVRNASMIWPEYFKQMKTIAIREAKRKNDSYRPHAVKALADFAGIRREIDLSGEIIPILSEIIDNLLEADGMEIDMDVDKKTVSSGQSRGETVLNESVCSAITCLFATLRISSRTDVLDQALHLIKRVHTLKSDAVEMSLYQGAQRFVEDLDEGAGKDASDTSVSSDLVETGPNAIGTNPGSETTEQFLQELILALFDQDPQLSHGSHASDLERLRLARIQTGSKTLHSRYANLATRETLQQTLKLWLEHEPSQQLRLMTQETLKSDGRQSL